MKRFPRFRALLLLGLTGLAGALTPAGTVIRNQVSAEFISPLTGQPDAAQSNTVQTVVQAVCAASITPDGSAAQPARTLTRLAGETAVLPYVLVNAGNDTFTFPLAGRVEAGSTTAPALRVVHDLNGNGELDPGEPDLSRVTLAPDASVKVLLVTGALTEGTALLNLVGGCAAQADENNVSRVQVGPAPTLTLQKTFTPALVRPGAETTVQITASNTSRSDSREVTLTDLLDEQAALGLTFVPGSAGVNSGTLEYTTDTRTWTPQETAPVRGVRVRQPSLNAGATLTLTFRMRAAESAEGHVIPNTVTARTGNAELSAQASVDVRYLPGAAIGPLGVPEAPEGTDADRQTRAFAVVGQPVCFDHTAKNTGDVTDLYRVTVTFPQGAATATLLGADGQPLRQPFQLDPGQTTTVRVCYATQQATPLSALLTLNGDRGPSNTTADEVTRVAAGQPDLLKSYGATTLNDDGQPVTVPQGRPVQPGDTVTYTLSVRNPYAETLTNVTVTDPLPAHVDFVSASAGGQSSGETGAQRVTWTFPSLAPGEIRTLTLTTRVSDRAVDGEALRNTFSLTSRELPVPLPSNEVGTPVWAAKLTIVKTVSSREATYGDRLTYTLKITNHSQTTALVDAVVTDTAPTGLEYVPGTSTLNGAPLPDPTTVTGAATFTATWLLPEIPAGATLTLTYVSRVTPQASGELVNTAQVAGSGAGGIARAIASNIARASTRLNLLQFAPQADLVGVVFVDRNRNGLFDEALDTPVSRARVLLAGGREALTDERGRYSFGNVPLGTHAVRLDPITSPYAPLLTPQAGGLSGTKTAHVSGLTSLDFPLAPLGGDISTLRRTTLQVGDVRVEKTVFVTAGGYTVQLRFTTPRAVQNVTFLDPLPAGATLKEGRNTLAGTLPAGESFLTYRFDWTGEPRAATTDPVLTWRN